MGLLIGAHHRCPPKKKVRNQEGSIAKAHLQGGGKKVKSELH